MSDTQRPYDPMAPSTIVLQVRVMPNPVNPQQMDLSLAGLQAANLPGGWAVCHDLLLDASKVVLAKAVQEAQAPRSLIEVAQALPENGRQG